MSEPSSRLHRPVLRPHSKVCDDPQPTWDSRCEARRDGAEDKCRNESPVVEAMAVADHGRRQLGSTVALTVPRQPGEAAHCRRHRLGRPYRRESGHDGTRSLTIQASTQGSVAIPDFASSSRTELQTVLREAATSAVGPEVDQRSPTCRPVVAATSPGALPVARMRASSTAKSRRAWFLLTGRPINPARAYRSSRARPESVTDPFTASPLRCSRRANASHRRSSPASSNVARAQALDVPMRWRLAAVPPEMDERYPRTEGSRGLRGAISRLGTSRKQPHMRSLVMRKSRSRSINSLSGARGSVRPPWRRRRRAATAGACPPEPLEVRGGGGEKGESRRGPAVRLGRARDESEGPVECRPGVVNRLDG